VKKKAGQSKKISSLRKRAEARHKGTTVDTANLSKNKTIHLVHELEVHQIELEMQNDELRRVLAELEESRSRYSDLYDFAPVGYFVFDRNGVILELNLTGAVLLGSERAGLIKKPFRLFVAGDFQDQFYLHRKKVFDTGVKQTCEIKLTRKDGSQFYGLLESKAVADGKGDSVRCRTIISDITKRREAERKLNDAHSELEEKVKSRTHELSEMVDLLQNEVYERIEVQKNLQKSEAKYRELVENANSIIMRRTIEGEITFFNEFAQTFFGYTEKEILGQNVAGTLIPETVPSGRKRAGKMATTRKKPEMYQDSENENILKNGRRVWIAWTNKAITDDLGNVVELLCIGNDITNRKYAEQQRDNLYKTLKHQANQLRRLNRELTQAEQRERQRLAKILHDHLQQLLVGVKLNIGVLRRKFNDNNLHVSLEKIDDLLDTSISVSKSLTVELCPPILQHVGLLPALKWLGHNMKQKYGLNVTIDSNTEIYPVDDECRIFLFEAVRELLFNIVKYAKTKKANIHVNYIHDKIKIEVADKGVGFNHTAFNADSNLADGFGLFNINERISLLGGQLDIKSVIDRGTSITLSVPAGKPVPLEGSSIERIAKKLQARLRTKSSPSKPPSSRAARLRVLLADDHKVVRERLSSLLLHEDNIEVVALASDGQMAVDMAGRNKPDVVIMDVSMPVMDGIEATRRIVAKFPKIKVIGFSMYDNADLAAKMQAAGAITYIIKGGDCDNLIAAIRACADGSPDESTAF
jgi:PAS domain S-box-containing protein